MPLRVLTAARMVEGFGSSAMRLPSGTTVRGLFRGPDRLVTDGGGGLMQVEDSTMRCLSSAVSSLTRGALVQVTRDDLGETTARQYRVAMLQPLGDTQHTLVVLERTS
jgi:hypothetical protein